jgi:hypothetical protein
MLQFQRKYLLVPAILILVGLLAVGLAQPAGAVINGTPDGTAHRNVGAVVTVDETGALRGGAPSGVLVAPTVMVVAGHSVAFGDLGSLAAQGRLYVSFAPTVDLTTTAGAIRVVHAKGLFPAIDVGVLVLAEPAHDAQGPITPATLPPAGLLDQLAAAHQLQGLPLTLVGYGVSVMLDNHTPDFSTLGTRRNGLQRAQASPSGHPQQLLVSVNATTPNPVTPGVGDSGAPYFLQGSNTPVGIVSSTPPAGFLQASWWAATRLDTSEVRSFLASFGVPLP